MSLSEKMFFLFVQKKSLNLKNLFSTRRKERQFFLQSNYLPFSSAEVSLVVNGRKRININ